MQQIIFSCGFALLVSVSRVFAADLKDDALTPIALTVAHFPEHIEAVSQALSEKPCELNQDYYQSNNQVGMEALLLCQALVLGGYRPTFKFVEIPVQGRAARKMSSGHLLMAAFGMWESHYDPDTMYKSLNLLDARDFEKGVFVSPENSAIRSVKSAEDLRQFEGISNRRWKQDWDALSCQEMNISSTVSMPSMFQMVGTRRADYMLTTFSTQKDLHQNHFGYHLVPIVGIKFVFNETLNFLVSKRHPQGREVIDAIDKGLAQLKRSGVVYNAYKTVGFYVDAVKDWQALGCVDQINN